MADKKIPVILITGYLVSGKTTLMQNLLRQEQRKIALIVNDMGSVNIDAALLNKNRDRINQLVFIGKGYKKADILAKLNACLVTA